MAATSCEYVTVAPPAQKAASHPNRDRKSTRLNSSHSGISYAVFCLKKNLKAHRRTPAGYCLTPRNIDGPRRRMRKVPLHVSGPSLGMGSWRLSALLRSSFFFNDTATPEIYPLSLHDALPI